MSVREKLIEVWNEIQDSIKSLNKLGYADDSEVVQGLLNAQYWLDDELSADGLDEEEE